MKKLISIFVLLLVAFLSVSATNKNFNTHSLASRTDKLFVGEWVSYFMPKFKTHEQFLKDLWENNEHYRNEEFWVVGKYVAARESILVANKYGLMKVFSDSLLRGNINPSIESAVNPTEYFKNILLEKNLYYKDSEFWVKGDYINAKTPILCENKYGDLLICSSNLLQGFKPSIRSAVNPTQYCINQFIEKHGIDKFEYDSVVFKNHKTKVFIYCKKCEDYFPVTPDNHLQKNGCSICANENRGYADSVWIRGDKKSKNFDSFKLYFIHCFNDEESFFKIGKTFEKINGRFSCQECRAMPYKYEILHTIINENAKYVCELEREMQKLHKEYVYTPQIFFRGMTECFSKINWKIVEKLEKRV